MEGRNIALHPYVDAQILEEIFKAVGVKDKQGGGLGTKGGEEKNNREEERPHTPTSKKGIYIYLYIHYT
jgi:hypothetical protein